MLHEKKFIRKITKFERWIKRSPQMAKVWKETDDFELRPEKYLDCGLELLKSPESLRKEIKQIYHYLKPYFSSLGGYGHPIPHLTGIVYMAYKNKKFQVKRDVIANIFGTNVDVVTKGYKEIRSFYMSKKLSENNSKVKCPRCHNRMIFQGCFWHCTSCSYQQFGYDLRKEFLEVNRNLCLH